MGGAGALVWRLAVCWRVGRMFFFCLFVFLKVENAQKPTPLSPQSLPCPSPCRSGSCQTRGRRGGWDCSPRTLQRGGGSGLAGGRVGWKSMVSWSSYCCCCCCHMRRETLPTACGSCPAAPPSRLRTSEDAVAAAGLHVELMAAHAAVPDRKRQHLQTSRNGWLGWQQLGGWVTGALPAHSKACAQPQHPCSQPAAGCFPLLLCATFPSHLQGLLQRAAVLAGQVRHMEALGLVPPYLGWWRGGGSGGYEAQAQGGFHSLQSPKRHAPPPLYPLVPTHASPLPYFSSSTPHGPLPSPFQPPPHRQLAAVESDEVVHLLVVDLRKGAAERIAAAIGGGAPSPRRQLIIEVGQGAGDDAVVAVPCIALGQKRVLPACVRQVCGVGCRVTVRVRHSWSSASWLA